MIDDIVRHVMHPKSHNEHTTIKYYSIAKNCDLFKFIGYPIHIKFHYKKINVSVDHVNLKKNKDIYDHIQVLS
jgi:hypothetical protein